MTRVHGFALGANSLLVAFKRLLSTPALWPYALLPCVTLVGLTALLLAFAADPLVTLALARTGLDSADTWYGSTGRVVVSSVLWLTSALVALWIGAVTTPPLCAPALEHLVRAEERELHAVPRPKLSIWAEWSAGLQAQAVALVFSAVTWGALTLLNVLLPALAVVTLPLSVLAVAAALAWSLLDYPLTLRGIKAKRRVRLFARQPLAILGFGVPFALLFWFPCSGVLLLPVGAIAATRVVWQLAERDPCWLAALTGDLAATCPDRGSK